MMRTCLGCLAVLGVILCAVDPGLAGYDGTLSDLLLTRHPSPRAEAMGRAYVVSNEMAFAGFSNPACLTSADGGSIYWSGSSRYYTLEDAAYTCLGGAFRLGSIGGFGLSRYHLDYGTEFEGRRQESSLTTVSYSRSIWRDLLGGLNVNRIRMSLGMEDATSISSDIGLLHVAHLGRGPRHDHELRAGISLSNFTYSSVKHGEASNDLPVVLRVGLAYALTVPYRPAPGGLRALVLQLHAEYKSVLNSGFHKGFRIGGEVLVFEVLALRLGHYGETLDDYGSDTNKDRIGEVTYGFGVRLPIDRITSKDVPLDLAFDMVRLDQPSLVTTPKDWDKYSLYSVSACWRY
jgi:hypothetical protein